MKNNISAVRSIVQVLLMGLFCTAIAQGITIDVDGGVSQPIGVEISHWNTGFDVGTNIFIWPTDRFGLGLRVGYDQWTPNKTKFSQDVGNLLNSDVSGSTNIIEIIPSARITTGYKSSGINFFGQVGTGIFAIKAESNVTGLLSNESSTVNVDKGEWIGRWGFQIGPGVSFGSARFLTVDVFPLYNVVFNGNVVFQYVIANVGLSFKF
jgi:hypothetical protein